jgi:uncharacterized protein
MVKDVKNRASMSAKKKCLFIQFAKRPLAGQVKTRLIPAIGADGALQVHLALVAQTLETLVRSELGDIEVWLDEMPHPTDQYPEPFFEFTQACERLGVIIRVQVGPDLGARMVHALHNSLAEYEAVVLVGSDCPVLTAEYLTRALAQLHSGKDIVFGAAEDGGYVLIGATRTHPGMLDNVAWGSSLSLIQSQAACLAAGMEISCLEPLWDVDEAEDLLRWQRVMA